MEVINFMDGEDVKIEKFPFKGENWEVIGTSIRWLLRFGNDGTGYPEYELRYFAIKSDYRKMSS